MIREKDFTLIGPVTSVGNMYLGPFYYYMMLLPMLIFGLDPAGPAYMVAAIGVVTVYLVYLFGKIWFGKRAAIFSSFMYAVSALVISWTRTSWNPNPMPFFSLLLIFSLYKVFKERKYIWLVGAGLFFAMALQMHYFGLVLLGVIVAIWLLVFLREWKSKENLKQFLIFSFCFMGVIFLMMLPLVVFDIRHDFLNYKAIKLFFSERKPDFSFIRTIKNTEGRTRHLIGGLFTTDWIKGVTSFYFLAVILGGGLGILEKKRREASFLIILWLFIGILGLASYYGDVYGHYLGFLMPAPFFLMGILLAFLSRRFLGWLIVIGFVGCFSYLNLTKTPFLKPLGWSVRDVEGLARKIYKDVETDKFNLVWISPVKDYRAMNYRFFIEKMGKKPLSEENYSEAKVLYVIVEGVKADPVDYPIWEIQKFGRGKVDRVIESEGGPKVYKLVKNK